MNTYFKKSALIILLILSSLFLCYIVYSYFLLSNKSVTAPSSKESPTLRGNIMDVKGKPLAVQTNFYHVGITPKLLKNKTSFIEKTAEALDMDRESMLNIMEENAGESFYYLKKKLDSTSYTLLKQIVNTNHYNFVSFDKIPGRSYPENALASHVIGFMGDDGKGLSGIEYSMQDFLRLNYPDKEDKDKIEYHNIYLTIDSTLQYNLEGIAKAALNETQAESIMLLAADATNGEILSYISLPAPNLNEYGSATAEEKLDRPAMDAYEPGSVFKVFSVAIAKDAGVLTEKDTFICDGAYTKRTKKGELIRIGCLEKHGRITARDALKYSCNDAIAQISDRLNDEYFIARLRQLGFGSKTGIELPGETTGQVKDVQSASWSMRSKPTISIGQEIAVSALQIVQAAMSLANNGSLIKLTLLRKITDKEGKTIYEHKAKIGEKVFNKATTDYLLSCMYTTAEVGTGQKARLNDVDIGVKTGTAQMAGKGGYSETDFLSNCLAIFPIENPKIILYIVIQKAKGETYAGRIVAPVIAKAASEIIDYMGLTRESTQNYEHSGLVTIPKFNCPKVSVGDKLPNFSTWTIAEVRTFMLTNKDIKVKITGSGWVHSQEPPPGSIITSNLTVELNMSME